MGYNPLVWKGGKTKWEGLRMPYDISKAVAVCKSVMEERKLTVMELSRMSGLSAPAIKRFLSGKTSNPSAPTLHKLMKALGLSMEEML